MSGIVEIDRYSIISGGPMPKSIASHMTETEYSAIITMYQHVEAETQCVTCGVEVGICLCTGFFCIFCAHPCVQLAASDYIIKQRMDCLNRSFYGGQPVLSVVGMGSISINLDLIDRASNQQPHPVNGSTKEATSAERPYTMVSKEDDDNIDTEYNKV